jgi:hypothetical protein
VIGLREYLKHDFNLLSTIGFFALIIFIIMVGLLLYWQFSTKLKANMHIRDIRNTREWYMIVFSDGSANYLHRTNYHALYARLRPEQIHCVKVNHFDVITLVYENKTCEEI